MRPDFDSRRDLFGPMLALQLRAWGQTVLEPAQALRRAGLYLPATSGDPLLPCRVQGGGIDLLMRIPPLTLLDTRPEGYDRVAVFDEIATDYESAVAPYSGPLFHEALCLMREYLVPHARLLDIGCGPAREARIVARELPLGEVIGADLSEQMMRVARENVIAEGIENIALVQCDIAAPPPEFSRYFDCVYCGLVFHYLPDMIPAVETLHAVLAPGGVAFVADPSPTWFNTLGAGLSVAANPAFVGYRSAEEFCTIFRDAGFKRVSWVEILPGIGLTVAERG